MYRIVSKIEVWSTGEKALQVRIFLPSVSTQDSFFTIELLIMVRVNVSKKAEKKCSLKHNL